MSKYKVGDKVRIIRGIYLSEDYQVGKVVEVTEVTRNAYKAKAKGCTRFKYGLNFLKNEIELVKENNMEESKYKVGQVLRDNHSDYHRTIVGVFDDNGTNVVVTKDSDDDLYNAFAGASVETSGWKTEKETTEVTLEEVAKKFNVSVEKLRIKD